MLFTREKKNIYSDDDMIIGHCNNKMISRHAKDFSDKRLDESTVAFKLKGECFAFYFCSIFYICVD